MQVFLKEVAFNHDPDSATADAFNIRKNEAEEVVTPEWQSLTSVTPEQSPAAYARDELTGTPTILAKFSFENVPAGTQTARIRAVDANQALTTNVLGSVTEREVELANAGNFESFQLQDVRIAAAGVSVSNVIWRWQFRSESTNWTDFETSRHRIYTVLKLPTLPWKPGHTDAPTVQTPWTEVLEYACMWAANAQDVDEAANMITTAVSNLGTHGVLQYCLDQSGAVGYVHEDPPRFDCTDFLNLLRGHNNQNGPLVNCDDCAAIVTSFSNILGCDLFEGKMGADFGLNPHKRIGLSDLFGSKFSHHTVAWKDPCGEDNQLFDACVRVDSDTNPVTSPHPLMIPKNIRFGRVGEREYRFRLVKPEDEQRCEPKPTAKVRRLIGLSEPGSTNGAQPNALIEAAATRHDFDAWKDSRRLEENLFILNFFLGHDEFSNWRRDSLRLVNQTHSKPVIQTFWKSRNLGNQVTIRIESHERESQRDAYRTVLTLLSQFHLPDITRHTHATYGDVAFSIPTNFVILFARGNLVFLLRNVGKGRASCEPLAKALDEQIISKPHQALSGNQPHSLFSAESAGTSTHYLKPFSSPEGSDQQQFKFFSSGEVSLENGELVYRPPSEGSQSIEVFAIDATGGIHQQLMEEW